MSAADCTDVKQDEKQAAKRSCVWWRAGKDAEKRACYYIIIMRSWIFFCVWGVNWDFEYELDENSKRFVVSDLMGFPNPDLSPFDLTLFALAFKLMY